jgi:glycosyltransferase involved in cell wall biosynthesis
MATYNGAKYVDEQLRSLAAQSWPVIDLVVRDDGSEDGTVEILEGWRSRWSKGTYHLSTGHRLGFAGNFGRLLATAPSGGGYVAFSDQDDVWHPDKLREAVARLDAVAPGVPALYGSRTRLVNRSGCAIGFSPLFAKRPDFRNALVQSIAGGNTMVMNAKAFDLVSEGARRTGFVSHDWWSYLIVSGAGGRVIYDPVAHIDYRQHGANQVGSNTGVRAQWNRLRRLVRNQFGIWSERNIGALRACADLLTDDNRALLESFAKARRMPLAARLFEFRKLGLYRQTVMGSVSLWLAVVGSKI